MEDTPTQAAFSDRLVAFAVDFVLVLAAYYAATLAAAFVAPGLLSQPAVGMSWPYTFFVEFCLYHAALGSGGRVSAGKKLMGIRVTAVDGSDLGFGQALLRAGTSLLSTAALGLGFLWALGSEHRAWHDRLAKTVVVETRAKGAAARTATVAGAWALGALMLAAWIWVFVGAPRYAQMQLVANAQVGMQAVARLQQGYHERTGEYAPDLDSLLKASGRESEFKDELGKIVDMSSLKFEGGKDSYTVEAAALDDRRTLVWIRDAH
jgi:uncharacterized RDD family membrane protein YckC